jgi:hypothetical protein
MRLNTPGAPHLSYCTNIHPGESWTEVRSNLETYTLAVKERVSPGAPFGLGLRLSARAAEALERPEELERFRDFLRANDLYLFTINGFPFGPFHGEPVKEEVYLPDWTDLARLGYTDRLATLMAALLPDDPEVEGSISTVPGAFRDSIRTEAEVEVMAAMMVRHAAHLYRLREETGKRIALAVEPEPCCYLEVIGETIEFFQRQLWSRSSVQTLASLTGLGQGEAEEFLRRQVGVCFDTCHLAVEYEGCEAAVRALQAAGIRIPKAQVTAGLEVDFAEGDPAEQLAALRRFADPVYLHQVVEVRGDGVKRFLDLPQALAEWSETGPPPQCRVHFHVPLFREQLGPFRNTQEFVGRFLAMLREEAVTPHLEVETYTWDVLPEEFRRESIVDAVAGELQWVLRHLHP